MRRWFCVRDVLSVRLFEYSMTSISFSVGGKFRRKFHKSGLEIFANLISVGYISPKVPIPVKDQSI